MLGGFVAQHQELDILGRRLWSPACVPNTEELDGVGRAF